MKISLNNGRFLSILFVISVYICSLILLPYLSINVLFISNIELLRKLMLLYQFLAIFIIFVFTRKNKINSIDSDKNKFSFFKAIGYGVFIFVIIILFQIILGIIMQVLSYFLNFDPKSANTENIAEIVKQHPIFIIYVVIFAPILEELVFRKAIFGYLYDIFVENTEKIRLLISSVLTGLIFALPHDGLRPIAVVYVIMSVIFSYSYRKTSNIITPIIAHMLMNSVVVIIQYYFN